jgi:hypothetical protein
MQRHYSHVDNDEKRAAMAGVLRLVPLEEGTLVGTEGDFTVPGQRSNRPRSFERDTGVEPATFSFGIEKDTE